MTKQEFIQKIKEEVLGYSPYNFIDHHRWRSFQDAYFFRNGEIENEKYSSSLNQNLSGVAMLQTINEIEKRLQKFLEKYK